MSATHGTFVWYELVTTDLSAARAFYARLLGWRLELLPGGNYAVIHVGATPIGGMLVLPAPLQAQGARLGWVGYVEVDDLAQAVARVQSLGGKLLRPVSRAGDSGLLAPVADPLGAVLHLFHPARPLVPDFSMTPGRVAWRELRSPDWQRCFGFYHVLFGWERGEQPRAPAGKYPVFRTAGVTAGGMGDIAAAYPGGWQYYFAVGNIDAATALVAAGGGHVLEGPHELTGGMWILEAIDPQGAVFALLGPR